MSAPKFAPREVFEQILEWAVIPTFDLVLEIEGRGYVLLKRTIAPYQNQWALPGLRMYKGESIDETLTRIAQQEVGLTLPLGEKRLLGQYVGRFQTEHQRQDLSSGYFFKLPADTVITPNPEHFSASQISYDIPKSTGAMYRYYLELAAQA